MDYCSSCINPLLNVVFSLVLDINIIVEIDEYAKVNLYDTIFTNEEKNKATDEASL